MGTIQTQLKITDGSKTSVDSSVIDFDIISRDSKKRFPVRRAYAVENLCISTNLQFQDLSMETWPYLQGLKFPEIWQENVTVLIGIVVMTAHQYDKVRIPPCHMTGPAAFKTPFGWCLGLRTGPPAGGRRPCFCLLWSYKLHMNSEDVVLVPLWGNKQDKYVDKSSCGL